MRLYVESLSDGRPKPITEEGVGASVILSPKGDLVADSGPDRKIYLLFDCGRRTARGTRDRDVGSADGLVFGRPGIIRHRARANSRAGISCRHCHGKAKLVEGPGPADSAGIDTLGRVLLSSDNKSYIYSYVRTLSDLYLVEGLK